MLMNPGFLSPDFLVPVPLNKLKQRERGYNQVEFICRGISDVTRMMIERSLIVRKRYTQSQTELDRNRRRENVEGAFAVNPKNPAAASGALTGRSIVLVDDVITTGATVEACARELVAHGADRVLAVSAALAS
jgi:ComF family protein